MKYNILFILLIIMKLTVAQQFKDSKIVTKRLPLKEYTEIELENRYGIVHVNTWDKDSFFVKVEINAFAKSQEKLDKTMSNIDIEVINTDYYISVKSQFIDNSKNLLADFNKTFFDSEHSTKINYTVYIPESANIKIDNKYGDIYCGNLIGDVELSVSYGKLRVNRLKGKSKIEVKSGEASINEMKKGTLISYFSEISISKSKVLDIDSHDSDIEIEEVDLIKLTSKRDDIKIENIRDIEINSNFSDISIENIENKIFADMLYGNINVRNITNSFSNFNLKSKYTNAKLYFASSTVTYNLDIIHKNSRIIYPRDIAKIEEKLIDLNDKRYRTTGKIGTNATTNMLITVGCDFGEVALFHK